MKKCAQGFVRTMICKQFIALHILASNVPPRWNHCQFSLFTTTIFNLTGQYKRHSETAQCCEERRCLLVDNCVLLCSILEIWTILQKFSYMNSDQSEFQNLAVSSLSKDTSLVKFLRRSNQRFYVKLLPADKTSSFTQLTNKLNNTKQYHKKSRQ